MIWFLASAKKRAYPYPAYAKARRLDPVHHSPVRVLVLFGHAEVTASRSPHLTLRAVLDRMADLHLAGEPVRRPSFASRGLTSLPLGWIPTGD